MHWTVNRRIAAGFGVALSLVVVVAVVAFLAQHREEDSRSRDGTITISQRLTGQLRDAAGDGRRPRGVGRSTGWAGALGPRIARLDGRGPGGPGC